MSGVLNRLVARATGVEKAGVLPRLPSRFEVPTGATALGFRGGDDDVPAPVDAIGQAEPSLDHRPSDIRDEAATDVVEPGTPKTRKSPPARLQSQRMVENPALPRQVSPQAPAAARPDNVSEGMPEPFLGDEPVTVVVAGAFTDTRQRSAAPPQEISRDVDASFDPSTAPPPEPLLMPDQTALAVQLPQEVAPVAPPDAHSQPTAATDPPAPEISIHIGRIELRGDAPGPAYKTAPETRRDRSPAMTTLADYLKGGGA